MPYLSLPCGEKSITLAKVITGRQIKKTPNNNHPNFMRCPALFHARRFSKNKEIPNNPISTQIISSRFANPLLGFTQAAKALEGYKTNTKKSAAKAALEILFIPCLFIFFVI
jgi:hypothetical protein